MPEPKGFVHLGQIPITSFISEDVDSSDFELDSGSVSVSGLNTDMSISPKAFILSKLVSFILALSSTR